MVGKLNHVGIAVKNIEETARFYIEHLGFTIREIKDVADKGVRIAFLVNGSETMIELVQATDDSNTVAGFVAKRGEGLHHLCYETPDIQAEMDRLKGEGLPFTTPGPTEGADGLVAFIQPKAANGVLIELLQVED